MFVLDRGGYAMPNLTISIDDEIIKRARVRAIQQGTSVSAKIREFLQEYVNESDDLLKKQRADATARLMQAIEAATAQTRPGVEDAASGAKKRRTLREDLYEGDFRARNRAAARTK
jgi:plasmid stability protein